MVVSMTLKELERMAQETAAFGVHPSGEYIYSFYTEQLQAFAKLVAEHEHDKLIDAAMKAAEKGIDTAIALEREACAKVCDAFQARDVGMQPAECAGAIRARGQA
jgi:hypothetical protein